MEYDREGNEFIGSKIFEYNYDGYNRLSIVKDPMKRFTEYSYNNLGLRSNKKIGNEEINYLYNGDQIVLETYKDGLIKAKNIRGRNLIYRQVNEKELYYLHNERGDVIKLLDDKGSLVKNYEYDPYGNENITKKYMDRNIDNPFRYVGEYLDEETGNYYLRARYYNPEIQRFISEDQVKGNNKDPFTYNLYGYCEGNPIRYIDPSGNITEKEKQDFKSGKLSKDAYTHLNNLTSKWYNAKGNREKQDAIHAEANEFRKNGYRFNYIYYTSGKDADFSEQAAYYKSKMQKNQSTPVKMIEVNSARKFVSEWNNMGNANEVMIIAHSNFHSILFEHLTSTNAMSTNGKGFSNQPLEASISDLKRKKIKKLVIHGCNSGLREAENTEKYGKNIQRTFFDNNDVEIVDAWDGSVSFGPPWYTRWYDNSFEARLSNKQESMYKHFIRLEDNGVKNIDMKRSPKGLIRMRR